MQAPQTPASSVTGSKSSKGKAPSVPNTTPSSRLDMPKSLSDRDKARVRKVQINSGRCVVENCDEERAVDFAHVVARRFASDEMMETIEWYWNICLESLNLDTRWNVFRAGAAIHRLFDNFSWVLVPEESIVQRYHDSLTHVDDKYVANRYNFPNIPIPKDKKFKYNFIPISPKMDRIAVTRQDRHPTHPTPNDFTIHTYPFTSMPFLESHVHPKFALLEAGYALNQHGSVEIRRFYEKYRVLNKVADIYSAWTAEVPRDATNDSTYHPPVDDSDDNGGNDGDSNYTEGRRSKASKASKPKKRSRQNDPQTPTPAPKSQRGKQSQGRQRALKREPSLCLSKKSLEVHDHASGEGDWTNQAIQHWSEGCRFPLRDADHTPWMQFQAEICV